MEVAEPRRGDQPAASMRGTSNGAGSSRSTPSTTARSPMMSVPRRVDHPHPAQDEAPVDRPGTEPASRSSVGAHRSSGQQGQDRHPDRHAVLDLASDERRGAVDSSAPISTPSLAGPGCRIHASGRPLARRSASGPSRSTYSARTARRPPRRARAGRGGPSPRRRRPAPGAGRRDRDARPAGEGRDPGRRARTGHRRAQREQGVEVRAGDPRMGASPTITTRAPSRCRGPRAG